MGMLPYDHLHSTPGSVLVRYSMYSVAVKQVSRDMIYAKLEWTA
jgi:hypothetical protein